MIDKDNRFAEIEVTTKYGNNGLFIWAKEERKNNE